MPATIVGSGPQPFPKPFTPPIIEVKANWSDPWKYQPELEFVSAAMHASSHAVSSCEVERKYGNVKAPYENAFSHRAALNYTGYWLRMSITGDQGTMSQFVGRIEGFNRELIGSAAVPAGIQKWVAYGGLQILQKMTLSQSTFANADNTQSYIGHLPPMNARDKRNTLVGNRSSSGAFPGPTGIVSYLYGGTDVWNHRQYIQYLIAQFIQANDGKGGPVGPVWTLGGQTDVLDRLQTTIKFPEVLTAAEMLNHLIPPQYGVDYYVKPTAVGFQITVFSLSPTEISIAGATLPKNPNQITIDKSDQLDIVDVQLVETSERHVDLIEVVGKRIVVCGSLHSVLSYTTGTSGGSGAAGLATLVPKWGTLTMPDPMNPGQTIPRPNSIEQDYINAGGLAFIPDPINPGQYIVNPNSDATQNDRMRKREKYRDVYQHYGAPTTWDLNGGTWAISCLDDGTIVDQAGKQKSNTTTSTVKYCQTQIRETLSWIPLKEGFDYSVDPPVDNTLNDGGDSQLKGPIAWILDPTPDNGDPPHFVQCDLNGMAVHGHHQDWGVFLSISPNHLVALNHWTDDSSDPQSQLETSEIEALKYDYNTIACTIAIESDHRIRLGYTVPQNMRANDGSVLTIMDEEAELWVMLPQTTVDIDTAGNQVLSGANLRILRNDTARLALIMAGALARHQNNRTRALIKINGFVAYGFLLGQILKVVQQGDVIDTVGGPITSVEWIMAETPYTLIRTGYA